MISQLPSRKARPCSESAPPYSARGPEIFGIFRRKHDQRESASVHRDRDEEFCYSCRFVPMRTKAALLVDNLSLAEWQRHALEQARDLLDIELVLNCTNTSTRKRPLKHFLYYITNILCLRS